MSDNYEVPANHEVNYFALDFGRAKEVYTQWYYREIAIDCDTFDQLIQSKVRECLTQGISDNNIFTNDWKIIESLV